MTTTDKEIKKLERENEERRRCLRRAAKKLLQKTDTQKDSDINSEQ